MAGDLSNRLTRYPGGRFGLSHARALYEGGCDRRAALADLEAILTGQPINGENTDKTVEINGAAG